MKAITILTILIAIATIVFIATSFMVGSTGSVSDSYVHNVSVMTMKEKGTYLYDLSTVPSAAYTKKRIEITFPVGATTVEVKEIVFDHVSILVEKAGYDHYRITLDGKEIGIK